MACNFQSSFTAQLFELEVLTEGNGGKLSGGLLYSGIELLEGGGEGTLLISLSYMRVELASGSS